MTAPADRVRVGICAWADPALIEAGTFYPRKSMTAEARLRHYAGVFDVVEVNASYYAIPDVLTVRRWAERTPPGFIFHVKAWSLMTGHHPRAPAVPADVRALLPARARRTRRGEILADDVPAEGVDAAFRLFRAALGPLEAAGKLGYVLFQFAPWVHFEPGRLDYLASLPERLPGWTIAAEFRHRSWFPDHAGETLGALQAARLAHVITDAPAVAGAMPHVTAVTASTAVMRLHGRNAEGFLRQLRGEEPSVREKYDYLYTDAELAALVPELGGLARDSDEVFVSFNNNNRDYPVRNALALKRLLGQPVRAAGRPDDLFGAAVW
ncbi:MAG TPA: DUF72 domain-containing protein [Methylomirabilota bacterium]|nr:DUF72 domain-containing protein [Methylomirabilota bacterium]